MKKNKQGFENDQNGQSLNSHFAFTNLPLLYFCMILIAAEYEGVHQAGCNHMIVMHWTTLTGRQLCMIGGSDVNTERSCVLLATD